MRKQAKTIVIFLVFSLVLTCLCACGKGGSDEETVEITTVEETQAEQDEEISVYEKLYDEYSGKLETAGEEYLKELKGKSGELSKDALYDETVKMQDKLKEIYNEGTSAMTDATLESTDDDTDTYEKYLKKLETKYSDISRELTQPYKDRF
ncbi:MAG: hypothetical protein SPF55_05400 [Lentihominibacter sp.]|nr:hypothetical protein [Lentihominibacter sp.]